jgi:DNA-binding response OmpR family regulator
MRVPPAGRPAVTVLVVEDDPVLAQVRRDVPETLRRAASAWPGIAPAWWLLFREQPLPDLVLLDVMLPDADGFDILMRMRQHPVLKRLPVVMLTGKATRQAVIKGLAAGADGYLTKPFEPDSVMRAVHTVLGLERAGDPKRRPPTIPGSTPTPSGCASRALALQPGLTEPPIAAPAVITAGTPLPLNQGRSGP